MNEGMYREHILDLYKNPLNFGEIEGATHTLEGTNPLCGDEIKIFLKVENEIIDEVKFNGKGCAISIASASILSDYIKGKGIKEVLKMKKDEVIDMLEIPISTGRIKCATLFIKTAQKSLENGN